ARRESHYGATVSDHPKAERWNFSMDTEEYWYSRLGRRFRIGKDEIASRAEHWLIDRLGASPEIRPLRDDPRISGLDYGDLDHHHGTRSRAEDPRLALEYNAMMLVAGELVD